MKDSSTRQDCLRPAQRRTCGMTKSKPRQSTIKGSTARRLNRLVWAEINGKPRKVRFYRLVETVYYVLKEGVTEIGPATKGQKTPPHSGAQSPGST